MPFVTVGGISVPVTADLGPFRSRMQVALGEARRHASMLQSALKIGAFAGVAGGSAAAGMGAFAAKEAMDVESHMANLRRITGATAAETARLKGELIGVATTTPGIKFGETFTTAIAGAKMGVGRGGLAEFTKTVGALGVAMGGVDPMPLAEGIGRFQNVMGAGPASINKYASALVGLDNASTATAEEILNISQRVAPMGRLLGMRATDIMAFAAALRDAGINAETAGSSLSQLLSRMAERKHAGAFARIAGVSRGQFAQGMRDAPEEVVKDVAAGVGRMDPIKAINALQGLGLEGVRTRTALLALASSQGKVEQLMGIANREFRDGTALTKALGIASDTAGGQLELLWNNAKALGEAFGKHALPAIKAFAGGLVDAMRDARTWVEANGATFKAWGESIAAVFRDVRNLAATWPDWLGYMGVKAAEKLYQFLTVSHRFEQQLGKNFAAAWQNVMTVQFNAIRAAGRFLGDVLGQLGTYLGESLAIGLAKAMPQKLLDALKRVPMFSDAAKTIEGMAGLKTPEFKIKPKWDLFGGGEMMKGTKALPGFDWEGMVKDLPNLDRWSKPFADNLANARKQAEAIDRMGKDAEAKKAAGEARDRARKESHAGAMAGFLGGMRGPGAPDPRTARGRAATFAQQRAAFNAMMRGTRTRRKVGPRKTVGPSAAAGVSPWDAIVNPPDRSAAPPSAKVQAMIDAQKKREEASQKKATDMINAAKAVEELKGLRTQMDMLIRAVSDGGALPGLGVL